MPKYQVTLSDGSSYEVEAPAGASEFALRAAAESFVANRRYKESQEQLTALRTAPPPTEPPKTTALGSVGEFFKGIVPGAAGLVESAGAGISALLPEAQEQAVRSGLKSFRESVSAPFAPAPGYEESFARKIGEGLGSTAPFFALGPAGIIGRVAGAGLGTAAGAGEARMGAEAKGATSGERALATVLGAPVGLLDLLAPGYPGKAKREIADTAVEFVRRALTRGGIEGGTEAAQNIAQNAIARGVYDPTQGILEGTGESAAVGATVGTIASALLDAALGIRRRGGAGAPPAPAEPSAVVPPAGTVPPSVEFPQGELFGQDLSMARQQRAQPPARPEFELTQPEVPALGPQLDLPLEEPAPTVPAEQRTLEEGVAEQEQIAAHRKEILRTIMEEPSVRDVPDTFSRALAVAGYDTTPTSEERVEMGKPRQLNIPSIERKEAAEKPAPTPEPQAPAPTQFATVLTPEMLERTGLPKQSAYYRQLVNKDMADPAQQGQVRDVLVSVRGNPNLAPTTKSAVESVAMQAFGALGTQQEMFGPRGGVLPGAQGGKGERVQPKPAGTGAGTAPVQPTGPSGGVEPAAAPGAPAPEPSGTAGLGTRGEAPRGPAVGETPAPAAVKPTTAEPAVPTAGIDQPFFSDNRAMVISEINGVRVPFYLSTGSGGKKTVPAGKWYPFFGVGEDGWLNKGSEKDINNFYGSAALKAKAEELNTKIGDIRDRKPMTEGGLPFGWDGKSAIPDWRKSSSVLVPNINEGLTPISYSDTSPNAKKQYEANIANTVAKVESAAAKPAAAKAAAAKPTAAKPKKDSKRYLEIQSAPRFYSALARNVSTLKINAAPAAGWKDAIKGLVNKGQVKADEVQWSGIEDWLDLQKGKVTKEQIEQYLREGGVRVEETVLQDEVEPNFEVDDFIDEMAYKYGHDALYNVDEDNNSMRIKDAFPDMLSEEDQNRYAETLRRSQRAKPQEPTKFDPYQLPGGENYREVLLRLPAIRENLLAQAYSLPPLGERTAAQQAEFDRLMLAHEEGTSYRSPHWDQANVLAHLRLNDRTDADGKRVLFVEEIQSDWGQEGREAGFDARTRVPLTLNEAYPEASPRNGVPGFNFRTPDGDMYTGFGETVEAAREDLYRHISSLTPKSSGIPAAPFVTSTDKWLTLALKRIMMLAAEGGYDRVAFVTGAQSHNRFPIKKDGSSTRGSFSAFYGESDGRVVDDSGAVQADKTPMLQSVLKKLLPKVGGGQMQKVDLLKDSMRKWDRELMRDDLDRLGEDGFRAKYAHNEQPGFDITPAMRAKVSEGLPLFRMPDAEVPTLDQPLSNAVQARLDAGDLGGALRALATEHSGRTAALFNKIADNIGETKVRVEDSLTNDRGKQVAGAFDPETNTITLNRSTGISGHVLTHEAIHAVTSHVLENKSHPLTRQLSALFDTVKPYLDTAYGSRSLDEFVAEAMSNPTFQSKLAGIPMPENTTALGKFVRAIQNFFRRMLGMDAKTPESTLDAVDRMVRDLIAPAPQFRGAGELYAESTTGAPAASRKLDIYGTNAMKAPSWSKEMAYKWREWVTRSPWDAAKSLAMAALPLNALVDTIKSRIPLATQVESTIDAKSGSENKRNQMIEPVIKRVSDWASANRPKLDTLNSVIYNSTYHRVDPSRPRSDYEKKTDESGNRLDEVWDSMQANWEALGDDGRSVYKQMRDTYAALTREIQRVLFDRIDTALKDDPKKAKAVKDDIYKRLFEKGRIDPYFPLTRSGKYWLSYVANGEPYIEAFETHAMREDAIKALNDVDGVDKKTISRFSKISEFNYRKAPSTSFIGSVLRTLEAGKIKATPEGKAALDDTIENVMTLFVNLLPETSFAQSFRLREDKLGFNTDAIRALKLKTYSISRQLTNMEYGAKLNDLRDKIKEAVRKEGSNETDVAFMQELNKRIDFAISPDIPAWSKFMTSAGFAMTLGFNVSSAIINLAQTPIVTLPYLGARYGYGKTTAAIGKATRIFANSGLSRDAKMLAPVITDAGKEETLRVRSAPSLDNYDFKDAKNKDIAHLETLVKIAGERGQLNRSMAYEILEASEGDSIPIRINRAMGVAMHLAERMNRQVSLIAAYELELNRLENPKAKLEDGRLAESLSKEGKEIYAANQAIYQTELTNGGSSAMSAPRLTQNAIGRIAFMYKRYGVAMYYTMFKSIRDALKTEDPEVRKIALKQLVGVQAAAVAMAGVKGATLYGILSSIYDMFFADDDEETFDIIASRAMPEIFYSGLLNALTGAEISGRVGLSDLLFREGPVSDQNTGLMAAIEVMGGPVYGVASRVLRGIDDINEGNVRRGIEQMLPAAFGNVLKAERYATEGALTRRGDPIQAEFGAAQIVGQMFGFAPAEYIRKQEENSVKKRIDRSANEEKTKLLRNYYIAMRMGDSAEAQDVVEKMRDYNGRHPTNAISPDTIRNSMRQHMKTTQEMDHGILISKKMRPEIMRIFAQFEEDDLNNVEED